MTARFLPRMLLAAAFVLAGCAPVPEEEAAPPAPRMPSFFAEVEGIYAANCAACHSGGRRAPDLTDHAVLARLTDDQFHTIIMEGLLPRGMPPFAGTITEPQAWQLIGYLRFIAENERQKPGFVADPTGQLIASEEQDFRIDVIAAGLETPWGLAFLPNGRMLVTERPGRLRIVDNGRLRTRAVGGIPAVWERQDAGLLDVAVHPDYAENGWIYLAYTEALAGQTPAQPSADGRPVSPPSMVVIIRGRLDANDNWVDSEQVFRAPDALYSANNSHYGSRMIFDEQGRLYYSIGERGDMAKAQDLTSPLGKIHRVMADGGIPADNPFANGAGGAVPSIWSFGHRNPQGFAWDRGTGLLWSSEHGPLGGDEINIIEPGGNYGWGVASMGTQPGITQRSVPGMIDPVVSYTPALAPSGIAILQGDRYPNWRANLFVAALAGQQLRRLKIEGRQITHQEVLFERYGRVRTVAEGPDGLLYVILQNPTGADTGLSLSSSTPGMLIKLTPVNK